MARTKQDLEGLWQETFAAEVERIRAQSPEFPVEHWRSAGRTSKAKPNGEDLQWWGLEGVRQLESYLEWLEATQWEFVEYGDQPMIEMDVSNWLGDVYVKGYVDAVMTDGDQVMLVDYKTGSRTPAAMMQLGIYRVLLRETTGIDATHGVWWMTRKAEPSEPVQLGRYTHDYVQTIFETFDRAVESQVFLPKEGSHCFTCDVRSACYIQGGVDAWKYDSHHPKFQGLRTQEPNNREVGNNGR